MQYVKEEACVFLQVRWILSTCRGHIVELQPEEQIAGMHGVILPLPLSSMLHTSMAYYYGSS